MANIFRRVWDAVRGVTTKSAGRLRGLRAALSGLAPGYWASNHEEEARHYTGWNRDAIHGIANQAAGCAVTVFQVSYHDEEVGLPVQLKRMCRTRRERKFLRRYLSRLKSASTISEDVSKVQRTPLPAHHPLVRLLRRPNPGEWGEIFLYRIAQQICAHGSALVWIIRNQLGVPCELYIIPTAMAIQQAPTEEHPHGSWRVLPQTTFPAGSIEDDGYFLGTPSGVLLVGGLVDRRQVCAIRIPHLTSLSDGASPVTANAVAIDLAEQLDRSRHAQMKNAMRPGMVLVPTEEASFAPEELEGFKEDVKARNAGTTHDGETLLLPQGLEPHQLERTPTEMDYSNAHPQVRDQVLAGHATPQTAIGIVEATAFSGLYASMLQFTKITVQPLLNLIAGGLTMALAPAYEKMDALEGDHSELQIELKAVGIDDPAAVEAELATNLRSFCMTKNQFAKARGWPTREGWDDEFAGMPPAPPPGQPGMEGGMGGEGEQPLGEDELDLGAPEEEADEAPSREATGVRQPMRGAAPGRLDVGKAWAQLSGRNGHV